IKLSLSVMFGVILGFYLKLPVNSLFLPGIILTAAFILLYVRSLGLFMQDILLGILAYLMFIFFGISAVTLQDPVNKPSHYINVVDENDYPSLILGNISEKLKPGQFQDKYILSLEEINGRSSTGKLLINISRDTLPVTFEVGQRLAIEGELKLINAPLNPFQFNYREHMKRLGVYRQINVTPAEVHLSGKVVNDLRAFAGTLREGIITRLRAYDFEHDELAIIQALLLGQRQGISHEIYRN